MVLPAPTLAAQECGFVGVVIRIISMSAKSFGERLVDWRLSLKLSPAAASHFISQNKTGEPISNHRLLDLEQGAAPLPTEKFVLECLMLRGSKSGPAKRFS